MFLLSGLLLTLVFGQSSYPTDEKSCMNCLTNNYVHCLNDKLDESECGEFEDGSEDQKNFIQKFKYCSVNLKEMYYKQFTCKTSINCPAGTPKFVQLTEYDKEEKIKVSWGAFQPAFFCKVQISAKEGLNGKIVLEFIKSDKKSLLFLQPNPDLIDKARGTKGIYENYLVYTERQQEQ